MENTNSSESLLRTTLENKIKEQTQHEKVKSPFTDYINLINPSHNVSCSDGSTTIIDVQSDNRFMVYYIIQTIAKDFSAIRNDTCPSLSIPNLVGYTLCFQFLHALTMDLYERGNPSLAATEVLSNHAYASIYSVLKSCRIPPFMAEMLYRFATFKDPKHPRLMFINTFAAYVDNLDWPRTILPLLFFRAHDMLTNLPPNANVETALRAIYSLNILSKGNVTHKIGNYYGTYSASGKHTNKLNRQFESIISPYVYRNQTSKLSLTSYGFTHEILDQNSDNIYLVALLMHNENGQKFTDLLKDMSRFVEIAYPTSKTYDDIHNNLTGQCLINHLVLPYDLPTWTGVDIPTTAPPSNPNNSDVNWAQAHQYLVPDVGNPTHHIFPVDDNLVPYLYTISDGTYVSTADPRQPKLFDENRDVYPPADVIQPLSEDIQNVGVNLVLGFIIQHEEITGFNVPVETPGINNIHDENSQLLLSAIPSSKIHPLWSQTPAENCRVTIYERTRFDSNGLPVIVNLYNPNEVSFPQQPSENALEYPTSTSILGLTTRTGVKSLEFGFNVIGIKAHSTSRKREFFLWSSYRHVQGMDETRKIAFLASLRPIYGTEPLIKGSPHPLKMLP